MIVQQTDTLSCDDFIMVSKYVPKADLVRRKPHGKLPVFPYLIVCGSHIGTCLNQEPGHVYMPPGTSKHKRSPTLHVSTIH